MQAVILAAGEGRRMQPLTNDTPKPLIEVAGKTLLEHKLDRLPDTITEIVLVVGYQEEKVRARTGNSYRDIPITYVEQRELNGTAGALWAARECLDDRFLVMMGDDLYCRSDVEACVRYPWALLVQAVRPDEAAARTAEIITDGGALVDIVESSTKDTYVTNTGLYVLQKEIFSHQPAPKAPGSSELGLPQTLVTMLQNISVRIVTAHCWLPITTPRDLERAEIWVRENP